MRFVAIVCVCLSVLDFGVELLVVYMICVNSGCLDPRMQLQLFFCFFLFCRYGHSFYHSLHSYQGEKP